MSVPYLFRPPAAVQICTVEAIAQLPLELSLKRVSDEPASAGNQYLFESVLGCLQRHYQETEVYYNYEAFWVSV